MKMRIALISINILQIAESNVASYGVPRRPFNTWSLSHRIPRSSPSPAKVAIIRIYPSLLLSFLVPIFSQGRSSLLFQQDKPSTPLYHSQKALLIAQTRNKCYLRRVLITGRHLTLHYGSDEIDGQLLSLLEHPLSRIRRHVEKQDFPRLVLFIAGCQT